MLWFSTFAMLWFLVAACHQNALNSNSTSRRLLLRAALTTQKLEIDEWHHYTANKALFRDHYYSDKPPGFAILAIPGYLLGRTILRFSPPPSEEVTTIIESWLSTAFSTAVFAALLPLLITRQLVGLIGAAAAARTALFFAFGTAAFPYATLLMPHTISVFLIALALNAFLKADRAQNRQILVSGIAAGLAVSCELTAGIAALVVIFLSIVRFRARALWNLIGALIGIAPLLAYNWICFNNALVPGYYFQAAMPEMRTATLGFQSPSLNAVIDMLFGTKRGLLLYSPFLVLGLLGLKKVWLRSRVYLSCIVFAVLAQLLVMSCYFDLEAGGGMLPRYLTPILPFLVMPCAIAAGTYHKTSIVLGVLSITLMACITVGGLFPSSLPSEAIGDTYLRLLVTQPSAYNLFQFLGFPPSLSVAVFLGVTAYFLWIAFHNLTMLDRASQRPLTQERRSESNGRPSEGARPNAVCMRSRQARSTAFTLIELLVTVAVIGILASLLMPAFRSVKDKANSTRCISNLRQLGISVRLYADDNGGRLPRAEAFGQSQTNRASELPEIQQVLAAQVGEASKVFKCPSEKGGVFKREETSYEWNASLNGRILHRIGQEETGLDSRRTFLLRDREAWHARGRRNAVFVDGHAGPEGL